MNTVVDESAFPTLVRLGDLAPGTAFVYKDAFMNSNPSEFIRIKAQLPKFSDDGVNLSINLPCYAETSDYDTVVINPITGELSVYSSNIQVVAIYAQLHIDGMA